MKKFARSEWERAQRTIKTAATIIQSDPESATSRAFYAAFHALTALFASRGQSFSKHTALRSALHKDLIKSGEWPIRLKEYDFLMELCEMSELFLRHATTQNLVLRKACFSVTPKPTRETPIRLCSGQAVRYPGGPASATPATAIARILRRQRVHRAGAQELRRQNEAIR